MLAPVRSLQLVWRIGPPWLGLVMYLSVSILLLVQA